MLFHLLESSSHSVAKAAFVSAAACIRLTLHESQEESHPSNTGTCAASGEAGIPHDGHLCHVVRLVIPLQMYAILLNIEATDI
jgi:hypothetical protein